MAQRRFGPTLGAGVVVIEKEASKPIEAAPFGVTTLFGALEKGDVGKLMPTNGARDLFRKCGTRLDDISLVCPDAAEDFWEHGRGAGELWLIRITDGTERSAEYTFYDRRENLGSTRRVSPVLKVEAHNGGRWGGRKNIIWGEVPTDMATDLTETTINTGITMLEDEWVGGYVILDEIPANSYKIVSNTTAGVVTVTADSTMSTDYGAGTDDGFVLKLMSDGKAVSVKFLNKGEEDPVNDFGIEAYVDGELVKPFPSCNMDPAEKNDVEKVVNEDGGQWEILVTTVWGGVFNAETRPANAFGEILTVVTNVITRVLDQWLVTSPTGANPTFALAATTDDMVLDRMVGTVGGVGTTIDWVSDKFGALSVQETIGSAWDPDSPLIPGHTTTNGATVLADADTITRWYLPFEKDVMIGHELYPNYTDNKNLSYRITDNDHKSVTVDGSIDLAGDTAIGKDFMCLFPTELEAGYDGLVGLADTDFTTAMNPSLTLIKQFANKNKGLVRLAAPGNTATAVQKAGAALAEAFGYEWRYEIPSSVTDEDSAIAQIDDTLGRNDFAVAAFPSFAKVQVPEFVALKTISLSGAIMGREALVAKNYDGYHKAAAGVDVILPRVVELPTGDVILNEEKLNPRGIQIIKFNKGNVIVWGDRTVAIDPAWKWKHQRELMSYYEHVLLENFDWIIFAINDPVEQQVALSALKSFFIPEWTPKRAIRGDTFEEAASIKVDSEINTDLTMAAGDLNAEIILRLADTIERFKITIGKAGVFESVA